MLVSCMAAAGFFYAVAGGPRAISASLLGASIGTALLMWPFAKGFLGGGDVKLLGAVGAWVGASGAVRISLLAAVVGGALALIYLVQMKRWQRALVRRTLVGFARSGELMVPPPEELDRVRGIPSGVAIAIAAIIVLVSEGWP